MIELNNVTLLALTSIKIEETVKALRHCASLIKFADVKIVTDIEVIDDIVKWEKCEKLDYIGYSRYAVYDMWKHVDTEFVLKIDYDGLIVNADQWDNNFLNYDYIGAPWPMPSDNFSMKDINGNIQRVGNGGFTLRSRKIMKLASELNIPWESFHGYFNDDGFMTVNNRHIYEANGCKIAPIEVAAKFSHEMPIPEIQGIEPFGFHGKHSKYYQYFLHFNYFQ